jgi:hypothetical protein
MTRFFGRKTQISALQELWRDPSVRLVTCTGPVEAAKHAWRVKQRGYGRSNGNRKLHLVVVLAECHSPTAWQRPSLKL